LETTIPTDLIAHSPAPVNTGKQKCINWGKGEHRDIMAKAINDWVNKEGDIYDNNGEEIKEWKVFANKVGIPPNSFFPSINAKNPRSLGDGRHSKKTLMNDDDIKFAGCVLACADRGNDGLSSKEAKDMIQDLLVPEVSWQQARRQLKKYVLPQNAAIGVLKKGEQQVQATTSNRTNINVAQQYHWHRAVDEVFQYLRVNNTGLCQLSGKTFGEVMPNFIIGLDEMCLMSDAHGNLRVFASADKKKQEKLLQDSCCSITVVRTGTVSGITGPTYFLLAGTVRKNAFSEKYLIRHSMKPGSTILMTESAYMTDAAWLQVLRAIVEGYRLMPFIKDNPTSSLVEFLDGFNSHENVLEAHQLRTDALIISLKEKSNSLHVYQGYNQFVAKNDKQNAVESLYNLRKVKKCDTGKTRIDQYDLVIIAMQVVR
jgi:hypothetical protein